MKRAYLLRDVDPKLFKEFKTACSYYGISMRDTLIKHMENIVKDYDKVIIDRIAHFTNKKKGGKK